MQTSSLDLATNGSDDVVRRVAERSAATRIDEYSEEVRRLMEAGLAEMLRLGTDASPSVAAVVSTAGLSKDAFYRHFPSKDDFVAAIVDAGTARLSSRLVRRMQSSADAAGEVRAWVEGIMSQAVDPEVAQSVRVVVWNAHRVNDDARRRGAGREQLSSLLEDPMARLGATDPSGDARLIGYGVLMRMEEFLWRREAPSIDDTERVVAFALRSARPS